MTSPFVSKAPKLGAQPCLDGVRGFGIFVVVFGHCSTAVAGGEDRLLGFTAVIDGFFALSGFLITTLLFQEYRRKESIDFKKFFMRRALRLFPSLWLYCLVWLAIGAVLWASHTDMALVDGTTMSGQQFFMKLLGSVTAAFFYVFHNFYPVGIEMVNHHATDANPLSPLWTLSIEEQFYLVSPFIVYWCIKHDRIKLLTYSMFGLWFAIAMHRLLGYTGPTMTMESSPAWLRLLWMQRPDALFLGVGAAAFNAQMSEEHFARHQTRYKRVAVVSFVMWILLMQSSNGLIRDSVSKKLYLPYLPESLPDSVQHLPMYYYRYAFMFGALFAVMFAFPMIRDKSWWLTRIWSWKPIVLLGRLSYTMYIWHGFAVIAVGLVFPSVHWLVAGTIGFIISVAISIPIFSKFEIPLLMRRVNFAVSNEMMDIKTGKMVAVEPADGKSGASS